MSQPEDVIGPVIVWEDNGCEGWSPRSYQNLKEALLAQKYSGQYVITKLIDFEVTEISEGS